MNVLITKSKTFSWISKVNLPVRHIYHPLSSQLVVAASHGSRIELYVPASSTRQQQLFSNALLLFICQVVSQQLYQKHREYRQFHCSIIVRNMKKSLSLARSKQVQHAWCAVCRAKYSRKKETNARNVIYRITHRQQTAGQVTDNQQ